MIVTLHRLIDRLFAHHHAPRILVPPPAMTDLPPSHAAIPEGVPDKLPPPEDRASDCHYTLDPVTRHFVETPASRSAEVRH